MANSPDHIIVWTLPSCADCHATKRILDSAQVPYEERDARTLTDAQKDELRDRLGPVLSAPIVETPNHGTWAGKNAMKLSEIRRAAKADVSTVSGAAVLASPPYPMPNAGRGGPGLS